ncbi:pyridoxamine 5'-phosphate oxidase family protein [Desertifilum sp. FACHB-1129]|uniref:Pyridoxamine 5'-phosphate oxidase n=2 Tax=Desertifilum tharense IPPAS B-1220 TaxID=1781255 RepID=A0A1E5QLC9_9CYAN|nr:MULTISPECIES: pyridoxamine 5'-phosphate oxidase family protein [Desertifilum]MDA0208708.1 pyridoxamine 5'-phosphate oxidase family protein [Cyanobacteria bacterium FC1]MBD2310908.1 pyridoxamine 5'-phosphate oxidase family protein [Desertifilum sp. FACHB-1129]MBD2321313.1 pyridoxamine 5'-phosphate oxidase family protein [Desertifilum sp. FACHB-866]MBD2331380.1 pyridoxamine 5'-phosphate oxidase family protein [Desertifilum sp. FACHB-868]OEJ75489.1 pyridoxamine 5'-phosphate oxidase [Desertifil
MAKFYSEVTDELQQFIAQQKLFFTATAPTEGRINLSPKGMDTFCCINSQTVAYLDLTGSGNETAAHLIENGRITLMFCSFTEQPLILRLYGQGQVIRPRDEAWEELSAHFDSFPGKRQIMLVHVETAQTSCGYGVPLYEFQQERPTLKTWAKNKGEEGILNYWREKNQTTIDGLPTYILETTEPAQH